MNEVSALRPSGELSVIIALNIGSMQGFKSFGIFTQLFSFFDSGCVFVTFFIVILRKLFLNFNKLYDLIYHRKNIMSMKIRFKILQ